MFCLLDVTQWALQVGEIAGAKSLDASLVVPVKLRDLPRAARFLGVLGVLVLPLVLVVSQRELIEREEGYLERTFAEEYLAYKRRVRRWV